MSEKFDKNEILGQTSKGLNAELISPWLTIEEAASYLKVYSKDGSPNVGYIYKLVSSGLLTPYKLGKFNRFKQGDLDALLKQGGSS
ncbi:MAG: helix-turn-helix domain-containing protein [SAR324 cluster bacterium]|nr:helix-turn-helix domain-containing protein [SAR324 cluster bacterium]